MISIGDIVKADDTDDVRVGQHSGEVVSSRVDDDGFTWYWVEAESGMIAEYMHQELIVLLKAQPPYERFNGKSKNFE